MGVIQNSLNTMLGAITGGVLAATHIGEQKEANEIAKQKEAEGLQEKFLQNKEAIGYNISLGDEAYATATKKSGVKRKDREAAILALSQAQEKIEALGDINKRISTRFTELTGKNIIGDKK